MQSIQERGWNNFLLLGFRLIFPLEGGIQTLSSHIYVHRGIFFPIIEDKWRYLGNKLVAAATISPKPQVSRSLTGMDQVP